jgi:hypothetical protein
MPQSLHRLGVRRRSKARRPAVFGCYGLAAEALFERRRAEFAQGMRQSDMDKQMRTLACGLTADAMVRLRPAAVQFNIERKRINLGSHSIVRFKVLGPSKLVGIGSAEIAAALLCVRRGCLTASRSQPSNSPKDCARGHG